MAVQNDNTVVTKGDLKNLYADKIAPYLGANIQLQIGAKDYYSTDEKVVGVWTDGKPLYQKTIDLGAVSANAWNDESIPLANVDMIMKLAFVGVQTSGRFVSEFYRNSGDMLTQWILKMPSDTYPMSLCLTTTSLSHRYVTLQYTKTTDTANSAATTVGCYDINFPNNWLENTEIYFGNGLYGKRFTGTITKSANEFSMLNLDSSGVTKLINCGGSWYHGSEYMCLNGTNDVYQSSGLVLSNGILSLRTKSNQARTNAPYDIWALYIK